jgi:hypothetical protein
LEYRLKPEEREGRRHSISALPSYLIKEMQKEFLTRKSIGGHQAKRRKEEKP